MRNNNMNTSHKRNETNILQEPCMGIYPNVTTAYIGDVITFFITAAPGSVEITDQHNNLIGISDSTSFNWNTTGWTAGIYNVRATANGCSILIPVPIELFTACTSIDISADKTSSFIGDIVTFSVTVQPPTQQYYPVAITDENGNLVAPICTAYSDTCSSNWDTTGWSVGIHSIRATVGRCTKSIPITLLPACMSISLSVDKTSAYVGDIVTFVATAQPSTQSYPIEIMDQDNNLIETCNTSGGICHTSWDTKEAIDKSYIVIARAAGRCISIPVVVTLKKSLVGTIVVAAGLTAAIIYIAMKRKRRSKVDTTDVNIHLSK